MKKLLVILVLGLLCSGSVYADVLLEITSFVLENDVKKNFWTHRMTLTNVKSIDEGMNKAIKDCEKRNANKTCLIDTTMKVDTATTSKSINNLDEYKESINNFNSEILNKQKIKKLKIISGYTTDGNKYEFDPVALTINEYTIAPSYLKGSLILWDLYYISEFSSKKVVAEIPYSIFETRLRNNHGGAKKFNKKYKKEIEESKTNCGCEDPIYKTFLLDLETRYAYKVFHPQSNDPKLDGDFRLKKKPGHKIVSSSVRGFANIITSETAELLITAYILANVGDNSSGIFKKSRGSSNVPGSSTVSKSLSSGSGSVLNKKFGEVTLKQLIGASRR